MKPSDDNVKVFKVALPADLLERFNRLYWDPVNNRPLYGERSNVVRRLIERHVEENEA